MPQCRSWTTLLLIPTGNVPTAISVHDSDTYHLRRLPFYSGRVRIYTPSWCTTPPHINLPILQLACVKNGRHVHQLSLSHTSTLSHRTGNPRSEITTMSLYLRRLMLANRCRVLLTSESALSTTLTPVTYSPPLLPIICTCRQLFRGPGVVHRWHFSI